MESAEQDLLDNLVIGFREYEMCEAIFGLALVAMIFGRLSVLSNKNEMSFSRILLIVIFVAFFGKFLHARISARQTYNSEHYDYSSNFKEKKWY